MWLGQSHCSHRQWLSLAHLSGTCMVNHFLQEDFLITQPIPSSPLWGLPCDSSAPHGEGADKSLHSWSHQLCCSQESDSPSISFFCICDKKDLEQTLGVTNTGCHISKHWCQTHQLSELKSYERQQSTWSLGLSLILVHLAEPLPTLQSPLPL